MKSRIYIIILFCFGCVFNTITAQTVNEYQCGQYVKEANIPAGYKKSVFNDRFGNLYTEDELEKKQLSGVAGGCQMPNFLNVIYTGSWTLAEQNTVCQVVNYVMSHINTANIPSGRRASIIFEKAMLPSGVAGVGTPFYLNNCGIQNSPLVSFLNGRQPAGFNNSPMAQVSVAASGISFYNGSTPVPNTSIDLYTVILHEMLHSMGFASLIGLNGTVPAGSSGYSRWDKFLTGGANNSPLLIANTTPTASCCGEHRFNNTVFNNFTSQLNSVCNTNAQFRINGVNIAPVNRVNSNMNDMGGVLNRFSHLDETCATGQTYVMHPSVQFGRARRVLNPAEISILCALGYPVINSPTCSNCFGVLNDDLDGNYIITLNASNQISIPISSLTSNDILPAGNITYSIVPNGVTQITASMSGSNIIITGNQVGIFRFRYRATGCSGDWCDEADVEVQVRPRDVCTNSSINNCNLFCFGDFEGFYTTGFMEPSGNYFNQIGIPTFNIEENNSPDVVLINNNKLLHLFGCGPTCDRESIQIPLNQPILPNCTINVTFIGGATTNGSTQPLLRFFALNSAATGSMGSNFAAYQSCPLSANIDPRVRACLNGSNGLQITNIQPTIQDGATNLQPYTFTWTNNTGSNISHLLLLVDAANTSSSYRVFIDDLRITSDCQIPVSVQPNITTLCAGSMLTLSAVSPTATTYAWVGPNGFTANTQQITLPNVTTAMGGAYTVNVTNGQGCNAAATSTVTVNPLPTVAPITGANTVCIGSTTSFNSTTTGGFFTSSNPNIATVNNTTGLVTGISAGTATITYTVTVNGCSNSVTRTVTVINMPNVTITATPNPVCAGQTVNLSVPTAGTNATYQWSANGNTIQGTNTAAHAATVSTTYKVTVTNGNCSSVGSVVVNITTAPPIAISVSPLLVCRGSDVTLTATNGFNTYTWNPGGAGSNTRVISNIQNNTTISVTGTTNNGCTATATTRIIVDTTCCPSDIWITGNYNVPLTQSNTWIRSRLQTTILSSSSVKLDAHPTNGYVQLIPTLATDFFLSQPTLTGEFIAQALDGCGLLIPRIAPPIEDPVVKKPGLGIGTLKAYPNPVNTKLTLEFNIEENQNLSIRILDLSGREMMHGGIQRYFEKGDHYIELDVSNLLPGFYLYQVDGQFKKIGKFTKI